MEPSPQLSQIVRLLRKRAFVGHYQGRHLVDVSRGYRDVILLDSHEEELIKDLTDASNTLLNYNPNIFTSFTAPGMLGRLPAYGLWSELPSLPFGCYWFQIRTIVLQKNEVIYTIKALRSVEAKFEPQMQPTPSTVDNVNTNFEFPSINSTPQTIVQLVKFLLILVTTLLTGSFHVIRFLGEFTIKFLREASFFMHNSTPLMLGCLDFVSKVIGGFYIMLAMLWRGNNKPPAYNPNMPSIKYRQRRNRNTYSQNVPVSSID